MLNGKQTQYLVSQIVGTVMKASNDDPESMDCVMTDIGGNLKQVVFSCEGVHITATIEAKLANLEKTPDFELEHLDDKQLMIAKAAISVLPKGLKEDQKTFYTPDEWKERREQYGQNSELIIVHDGGPFAPYCNWDYEQYNRIEELQAALANIGYYLEGCTCWYSAVYKG
jgi:hypothetical protein